MAQQWDDVMEERKIAEGVEKLPYFKVVADDPMLEQNDGMRDMGELYPFLICGGTNTERYYFMHINKRIINSISSQNILVMSRTIQKFFQKG